MILIKDQTSWEVTDDYCCCLCSEIGYQPCLIVYTPVEMGPVDHQNVNICEACLRKALALIEEMKCNSQ
jgi:hypothetical protein